MPWVPTTPVFRGEILVASDIVDIIWSTPISLSDHYEDFPFHAPVMRGAARALTTTELQVLDPTNFFVPELHSTGFPFNSPVMRGGALVMTESESGEIPPISPLNLEVVSTHNTDFPFHAPASRGKVTVVKKVAPRFHWG
jgi:hypothetical protein